MKIKEVKTYFEPDIRWMSDYEISTIEAYKEKFEIEIIFNENVPEDLKKGGDVVKDLMVYAYYNYDILDEVLRKVLGVFELSVKLKTIYLGNEVERVNGKGKSKAIVLDFLIKQFNDEKDLKDLVPVLDELRQLRNKYANPKYHNADVTMILALSKKVVGVINEMFEK